VNVSSSIGRITLTVAAVVLVGAIILLATGGSSYHVQAVFQDASQLVKGNLVEVSGNTVGEVTNLQITPDNQALVTMKITSSTYDPLREGVTATIREASLSGEANRYVDLNMPSGEPPPIPDGGTISEVDTNSAVDLDQLLDAFTPGTQKSLSGVIKGFGALYHGKSAALRQDYLYFNPLLASSSRLFGEINYDTPTLTRFVVASAKFVTDLAGREQQLSGLVSNLASATGAIAARRTALASALQEVPPFFRQADTTFLNVRGLIGNLKPLVDESKPVALRLQPFLAQLRPLARDARPTLRDLSALISTPTPNRDLLSLLRNILPVRDAAIGPVQADGASHPGAFPETVTALTQATPELAFARPYAPDLLAWFDDFSHSGVADANGNSSRASAEVNAFALLNGVLSPIAPGLRTSVFSQLATIGERNRCPGSTDHGTVYQPSPDFNCNPAQTLPGT
jgi:phospholipid/cholesterol/gamma-HCH transport system substrate-binding protein